MTLLEQAESIIPLTQNTPVIPVMLRRRSLVLIKFEGRNNLSQSIKDRPAINMITEAIRNKELTRGMTLIESTSGNTGIGVAAVCQRLGFHYINFSPSSLSSHKRAMLELFGAEIELSEGGTDEATRALERAFAADLKRYYWTGQFTNDNNWIAHEKWTGPEIDAQAQKTEEVWCGFGSGGTSRGLAQHFLYRPTSVHVVQNTLDRKKRVEGMRNLAWISKPPIVDIDLIGEDNMYSADPARIHEIAKEVRDDNDGLLLAPTTAAVLTIAEKSQAAKIVVVSADDGGRYGEWIT